MQGTYKNKKFTGYVTHRQEKLGVQRNGSFRNLATTMNKAEKDYRLAQAREKNKKFGFWAKLRYFWLRAKIKTNAQMRKLFGNNKIANA